MYAINGDSWRAIEPNWALQPGEILSDTMPEMSAEQQAAKLLNEMKELVQAHIDQVAREMAYTDGLHAASYVASTIEAWAAEAQAFVAWRDSVWVAAISILYDCKSGLREIPSADDLLAELPAMEWPNV